jgi:hypothetical protein
MASIDELEGVWALLDAVSGLLNPVVSTVTADTPSWRGAGTRGARDLEASAGAPRMGWTRTPLFVCVREQRAALTRQVG